jgi:CRP/FNR family transcriptional regulator
MNANLLERAEINKLDVLNQYTFYKNAEKSLQDEIETNSTIVKLEPNSYFYKKGGQCSHIALVGSGSVRVFVIGKSGREATLYHVLPGESCPINILSAMLDKKTPALAIAEVPLEAVVLPVGIFRKWVAERPVVQQYVFEALASRLVDVLSLMEDTKFRKMDQRLTEYLLNQFENSDYDPPMAQITHEKIAIELGSAREVISRLLGELERMGCVGLARGRIILKDKALLTQLISV